VPRVTTSNSNHPQLAEETSVASPKSTARVGHLLKNLDGEEDLVYLAGGEHREVEIATFPKLGKHLIRHGDKGWMVDSDKLEEAWKRD
jgi:uncharacterized cupin superfamily protein